MTNLEKGSCKWLESLEKDHTNRLYLRNLLDFPLGLANVWVA